ncbi:MAG: hypothetical protein NWE98_01740 [Candidatus Bathyarchaeota archaeon]|nr:hypothetical protein [Candidatus Bathyarchaeota archaeon]
MVKENEEVLTTTTSEGDTSFMVCKTSEDNKRQKVCMEVDNPQTAESLSSRKDSSKTRMLDNNTYDLMEQLLIENKSLWRIKNNYKNDAALDNETRQLWNVIEKDKEELVQMLSEKLRERL